MASVACGHFAGAPECGAYGQLPEQRSDTEYETIENDIGSTLWMSDDTLSPSTLKHHLERCRVAWYPPPGTAASGRSAANRRPHQRIE